MIEYFLRNAVKFFVSPLVYSIFLCFVFNALSGQVFRYFPDTEGAPAAAVLSIAQDHDGYMWFGTTTGLYRYDSRTFKRYRYEAGNPGAIPSDVVRSVFCDSDGDLWIGTDRGGLGLYNRQLDSFTNFRHQAEDSSSLSDATVMTIFEDSKKRLWIGTDEGLDLIERKSSEKITVKRVLPDKISGSSRAVRSLAEGKDGTLWAGTYDGLIHYKGDGDVSLYRRSGNHHQSLINQYLTLYPDNEGNIWIGSNHRGLVVFDTKTFLFETKNDFRTEKGELPIVNEIRADGAGAYWIATESGLARYDRLTNGIKWFCNRPGNPHSLVDDVLYSICLDKEGSVWLGSYYMGISYLNVSTPEFTVWPSARAGMPDTDFFNSWMGIMGDGSKWSVDYQRKRIVLFDEKTGGTISRKLSLRSPETYSSFSLDEHKRLWCGSRTSLTCIDLLTGEIRDYPYTVEGHSGEINGKVYSILEDSQGRMWLGGVFGLLEFDKGAGRFRNLHKTTVSWSIFEDSKDNLWVACTDNIFLLKKGASELVRVAQESGPVPESEYYAYRVTEDSSGRIWVATKVGLFLFDKETRALALQLRSGEDDLGPVLDVQADGKGYLWLSGRHTLLRYHPDKQTLQTFDQRDGLPFNSILQFGSSLKDKNGYLYFITNKEIFWFNPDVMLEKRHRSPVMLTSLKLFGREISNIEQKGICGGSLSQAKGLTFRHDQDVFSLEFALLSYISSERRQYAYKLDGFEKDWNYVRIPSATYTNLPPGSYRFLVKAANGDGYWAGADLQLRITILPPWWKTWYAYAAYLILFTALVYGVTRFFWLRSAFRKENELYQTKLDFFTNISHEIRTHLSLISGPIEKAFQHHSVGEEGRRILSYAKNNSDRLMQLVNELLDFRKLQNGGIRLLVSKQEVTKVVVNTLAAFEHLATEKGIVTVLKSPETPVVLWFDLVQIQKVLYNVLSNAYKFTPEGGRVTIDITEKKEETLIKIANNGNGIKPEHLAHLFTNFFQVYENSNSSTGYGIGLALSKSILGLHKGTIFVSSRLRTDNLEGETCFTIGMRAGTSHFDNSAGIQMIDVPVIDMGGNKYPEGKSESVFPDKTRSLLVIEDNDELRSFSVEIFRERYTVLEADNGKTGLSLAREHMPDVIVCDVMMPQMNGLEVCRALKNDFNTRHIPIVLVSARSTVSQMKDGLNAGADDYLIKPFDLGVLLLKISNLIGVREAIAQRNSRSLLLEPGELIVDDPDAAFINQLKEIVLANLSDSKFGVNEIALHTGVSISVLYRKMRALTGMTVNDFVKSLRLKRAGQLLESGHYNVSEAASEVGFEDSRYFSKEFKKLFGESPNELRRNRAQ